MCQQLTTVSLQTDLRHTNILPVVGCRLISRGERGVWWRGGGRGLVVRLEPCAVTWSPGVRWRYTHIHTHTHTRALSVSIAHIPTRTQMCACTHAHMHTHTGTVKSLHGSRSEGPSVLACSGFTLPGCACLTSIESTALKNQLFPYKSFSQEVREGVWPQVTCILPSYFV